MRNLNVVALGKFLFVLAWIPFIGGLLRLILLGDPSVLLLGLVLMFTSGVAGALILWALGYPAKAESCRAS